MRDEARPREHARSRSEEDSSEPHRNLFFEPPYSIRHATAGLLVLGICRLLYRWIWGE